jgi:hypothetical protein
MKPVTLEQLNEIRRIAENKLLVYKNRASSENYRRALLIAMREIAHDMELQIPCDLSVTSRFSKKEVKFSEIQNVNDLGTIEREPSHILVASDLWPLRDRLMLLFNKDRILRDGCKIKGTEV